MKVWVINKRKGTIILAAIFAFCALFYFGKNAVVSVANTERDLPIYCVKKSDDEKVISISFDAAWGNEDTGKLIEILDKYNVKTTFFVVGAWVDKYPESVKELSDAGHEIMNHSNTHPHMTEISKEQMIEEVTKCDKKIEKITGKKPILFRAPYGDYNDAVVGAMRECGHYTIQWDVDSLDWKNLSPSEITERVTSKVKPGSIVLFHNAALHTPEALPTILEALQKDGYKIVPISKLIIKDNYEVDNSGMQCPNDTTDTAENAKDTKNSESTKNSGKTDTKQLNKANKKE